MPRSGRTKISLPSRSRAVRISRQRLARAGVLCWTDGSSPTGGGAQFRHSALRVAEAAEGRSRSRATWSWRNSGRWWHDRRRRTRWKPSRRRSQSRERWGSSAKPPWSVYASAEGATRVRSNAPGGCRGKRQSPTRNGNYPCQHKSYHRPRVDSHGAAPRDRSRCVRAATAFAVGAASPSHR